MVIQFMMEIYVCRRKKNDKKKSTLFFLGTSLGTFFSTSIVSLMMFCIRSIQAQH